jgi:acyl-CoA synthetase (AMP-forming)/AMP-acid ligase II
MPTWPRLVVAEAGFRGVALASAGQDGHDRVVTSAGAADPETCADGAERVRADPGPDLAAPVLILFTSGTTGPPKGATFTQENMTFNALNVITAFGLTAADEILTAVPMFHSGGLFIHTTPGLCAGATVTIHRQFDPGLLLEVIALFDGRLATYKHPRDVIFLDALPRNAAGKVQKTVLRDLVSKAGGRGRAPRSVRYRREFPSWHSGAGG